MFSTILVTQYSSIIFRKDPVSLNLAQFKIIQAPHWVPKMLHSSFEIIVILCLRYTELTRHLAGPG